MEKFKVGIIGLGCRGNTMGMLVAEHPNCAITAICDEYQDRCDAMKAKVAELGHDPKIYLNYEELIASPDVVASMLIGGIAHCIVSWFSAENKCTPEALLKDLTNFIDRVLA